MTLEKVEKSEAMAMGRGVVHKLGKWSGR